MDLPDTQILHSATRDRLAALARYGILDTPPEPGFDDIVLLATRVCEAPVALVSLVAADRQWFKARIGFPPCETPLSQSVCAHALREDEILVISDLAADARTRANTLVTADPFIRFYAGAVLRTPEGVAIGSLCVIDTQPRPGGLTPMQADSLKALARQVVGQLELRRFILERETALTEAADADALFRTQQAILREERQHRLKNVVTVVQAIVLQTLRHSKDVASARDAVSNRLRALVKGQETLFRETSEHTNIALLVHSIAELYQTGDHRFFIDGPEINVGEKAALALSLVLNELATNATKYGSLSSNRGTVSIDWRIETTDGGALLALFWRERGGPAVITPEHRGFGTTLIENALSGSTTKLQYPPSGVECQLTVPLERLSDG